MSAWPNARCAKRKLAIRSAIMMSCIGEALVLARIGVLHHDFIGSYLIVATWVKDFGHSYLEAKYNL